MNRFDYPFTRIITKPFIIKNRDNLELHEVASLISEDKRLQKTRTLKHFYPESEGKVIFRSGENIWFVLDHVTSDQIKITSVQKDNALYVLFAFIAFVVLLSIFSSGFRRFAFGFLVFSLMIYGLVVIADRVGDSNVKSKLNQLEQSINHS